MSEHLSGTYPYYSRWVDPPTLEQLSQGVSRATGLPAEYFDDSESRLEFVRQRQVTQLTPQFEQIHATVLPESEFDETSRLARVALWRPTLPGDDPKHSDIFADRLGLPPHSFGQSAGQYMLRMQRIIANTHAAPAEDRLRVIAEIEGFVIQSAQLLHDANTRVARIQSGLLQGGVDLAHQLLLDPDSRAFDLDECLEVEILISNTRLAMDERTTTTHDHQMVLSAIDAASERVADYLWPLDAHGNRPERVDMRSKTDRFTPDHLTARAGIMLRTYGAAALAASGVETPIDQMSDNEITAFEQALVQLMTYRIHAGIIIMTAKFLRQAGVRDVAAVIDAENDLL